MIDDDDSNDDDSNDVDSNDDDHNQLHNRVDDVVNNVNNDTTISSNDDLVLHQNWLHGIVPFERLASICCADRAIVREQIIEAKGSHREMVLSTQRCQGIQSTGTAEGEAICETT